MHTDLRRSRPLKQLPSVADKWSPKTFRSRSGEPSLFEASEIVETETGASVESVDKLVLSNLGLVEEVIEEYASYTLSQQDLAQDGRVGLVNAAIHFRGNNGTKFATYARAWIELEVQRSISRHFQLGDLIPTRAQGDISPKSERQHKVKDLWDKLCHGSGLNELNPDSLCTSDVNASYQHEAIDDQWVRRNESPSSWITTETEPTVAIEKKAFDTLLDEGLQKAFQALDSREQRIISALWFDIDCIRRVAVSNLAAEYGLSKVRIRHIEIDAFRKMRNRFLDLYPQLLRR